jgi:peroxiredoxin Q/BCP
MNDKAIKSKALSKATPSAERTSGTLVPGDRAPMFTLPKAGGGHLSLKDLAGQHVVLYFYPKDDTPGCTQQAISFSENADEFARLNAVVVGVSRDSVAKHDAFVGKHGLTVTLLSDETGEVCEAYGVWTEKTLYGRKFMGIERSTFLINPTGQISRVMRKVKVPGHIEKMLLAIKEMAQPGN